MKNNVLKRIISALLCLALIIPTAGCGRSSKEETRDNQENDAIASESENVFKESAFGGMEEFLGDEGYIESIVLQDDVVYMITEQGTASGYANHFSSWDTEGHQLSDYVFYSYTKDDTNTKISVTDDNSEIHEGSYTNNSWVSPDGNMYYFLHIYYYNDDWSYYEEVSYFIGLQSDGTEIFRVDPHEWCEDYSSLYFFSMDFSQEGRLILISYTQAITLDMEGNFVSVVNQDNSERHTTTSLTYNGLPVFQIWDKTWSTYYYMTMNLETGEMVEELNLPEELYSCTLYDGTNSGYDIIAADSSGIYGYDYGDKDVTLIMGYEESGIHTTEISDIIFLTEDALIGFYCDNEFYENHFSMFTRANAGDK